MRRVMVRPRRIPQVQTGRAYTVEEQQTRDLLKAKLLTSMLIGRLSQGVKL